tara:strand:- start:216 stop:2900 length:2685 start_codon:yes stop_codon:yes gene_type:complete
MTQSFRGTPFQSFASNVDTYEQGVRVAPKSGIQSLAETLAAVNPTIQKYLSNQIDTKIAQNIQAGQLQVLGSDPEGIDKLRKELEKNEGKRFARNFIGGNIYTQYGIEKQLAINLGNASEAKTKKFFDEYVVDVELPNGQTIQKPLSQFSTNSDEFQQAVNEFQETSLMNTRGIRPEIVNQFLIPKQNLALQKVYKTQEKNLADAKIEQANLLFNNSILNAWFSIDNINENIENDLIEDNKSKNGLSTAEVLSLDELQNNINYMVKIGLSSSVSPSKIIDVMQTNILQIFDYYENNNLDMEVAEEEIQEYINWIGNLKVTNNQPLRNFYIQDGEDKIETFMSDINKKKATAIKNQNAFQKQQDQENITNTLNNLDLSRTQFKDGKEALNYFKSIGNTLDALALEYPEQIEFLYKEYDLRNFSVDDFFFELETAYDDKIVTQSQALTQLTDVMQALGPNASNADRTKYKQLKNYLNETDGKSLEQRFPAMKELIKYGKRTVGEVKDGLRVITDADDVDRMEDLNIKLKSLTKENGGIDAQIDIRGQRTTVRNWYLGELRKIKNPKKFNDYVFYDPALDLSETLEFKEIPSDDGDGDGQDDGKTVNIQEQKVLTYDTNTKLFSEVNTNELQVGPTTTVVSINGSVTPAGESLRQNLKIKSFENFNVDFYNATFEDKQTETRNEKLLSDDLEASVFSDVSEKESPTTVEVEQGDTLSKLADQFGSSVQAIMEANNLTNPDMIRVGQELVMPIVERINMKEVKNNQIKALDVILKDTDKTKVIPQPKIEEMLLAVGFEPNIAKIMAAVSMAESAGDPMIDTVKSGLDPEKKKEFSIGLLQLNMKDDRDRLLNVFDIESEEELYDPIINVIAAKRLYDEQGLNAWGAYKNGSYKKFLKN